MEIITPSLDKLLDLWIDEDLGRGDLTSAALLDMNGSANWISKQRGIFCGGPIVQRIFQKVNSSIQVNLLVNEGNLIEENQKILQIDGPASALVAGERTCRARENFGRARQGSRR